MCILVGNFVLRIQHQHHDIGNFHGLESSDHRELLNALDYLPPAAQARSINERVVAAVAVEININTVARVRAGRML